MATVDLPSLIKKVRSLSEAAVVKQYKQYKQYKQ